MVEETPKRLLTVAKTCNYLSISRTTLYRMIEQKEIAPVIIGGRTLFDRKDLDDLIEKAKAPRETPVRRRGGKPSRGKE
jgi:excisionase family DNA binding protein